MLIVNFCSYFTAKFGTILVPKKKTTNILLYPGAGWDLGFVGQKGFPYTTVICFDLLPSNGHVGEMCKSVDDLIARCESKMLDERGNPLMAQYHKVQHRPDIKCLTWRVNPEFAGKFPTVHYYYDTDFMSFFKDEVNGGTDEL